MPRFRRWREKVRDGLTSAEMQERFLLLEETIRALIHDRRQAEVYEHLGQTVANLLQSLDNVGSACVAVGPVVVLKSQVDRRSVVLVRQLSAREMKVLEQFPDIYKEPDRFLQKLADAVALPPVDELPAGE